MFRQNKAQSTSEYVILIGIISLVLIGMQTYMKRGIQAVIKVSADEIGEQKKGGLEYDYKYEWKVKGDSTITSSANSEKTATKSQGGAVAYGTNDTTTQSGILSHSLWSEK